MKVVDTGRLLAPPPRDSSMVEVGHGLNLLPIPEVGLACLLHDECNKGRNLAPETHNKKPRFPPLLPSLLDESDCVPRLKMVIIYLSKPRRSRTGVAAKASDYDDVAKEVILHATAIYRCLVSTSNAFPTPSKEGELIKSAWNRANDETLQEVPIALTPVIAKVVSPVSFYCKFDFILFNLDCSTR